MAGGGHALEIFKHQRDKADVLSCLAYNS
ncbi:hypothetical protein CLUP02_16986 [Colletotrichum lupini]|uniref:Uncharacterized protein n=1 Tax=Colletotrichum lupini TaxID=145971 RepID=A0A9Q8TB76_9PEZI|nr:hypothetical protein CLUP02_16986 [Colletotrichum lupini]